MVNGITLGLVKPYSSKINGFSFAPVLEADYLNGMHIGLLGLGANKGMNGISIAGLGFGCDGNVKGVAICGLGGGIDGGPQWWWDDSENVLYFGDPDLRMYVPENEYSEINTWEKPKSLIYDEETNLNGHAPFGATNYPNAKDQLTFMQKYLWLIGILVLIVILMIVMVALGRKKKKR